jgi:GTP-binding protein
MATLLRKSEKMVYYVVNKMDSEAQETARLAPFYELGDKELHPVSAAHGYGINTFMDEMLENFMRDEEREEELPGETMRIAFLGRPNVGKSSLTNQLLGEDRMVVSELPGTTRDSVDTLLTRKGRNYLLIDTAGIRRKGKVRDKVEKFSVMRALSSIERCDLALIIIDANEGITEQDTKVIGYCVERGRACLVVLNKWDLLEKDKKRQKWLLEEVERATRFIGYSPTVKISALTGFGIKNIFATLHKVFEQFSLKFSTGKINRVLQSAVEKHPPSLYKGHRLKFYYSTQVTTKPPTFIIFVNYPKGVHFSYYRFLVNHFRTELNLDLTILRIFLRERQRKEYG